MGSGSSHSSAVLDPNNDNNVEQMGQLWAIPITYLCIQKITPFKEMNYEMNRQTQLASLFPKCHTVFVYCLQATAESETKLTDES